MFLLYVLGFCFHNPNFGFIAPIPLVHIIKFSFNIFPYLLIFEFLKNTNLIHKFFCFFLNQTI